MQSQLCQASNRAMSHAFSFPTRSQALLAVRASGASGKEVGLAISTCEQWPTYRETLALTNCRHKAMDAGVLCASFAREQGEGEVDMPFCYKKKKSKRNRPSFFFPPHKNMYNNAHSYSNPLFPSGEAGTLDPASPQCCPFTMTLRSMESRTSSHKPRVGHWPDFPRAADQPLSEPHTFKSYPGLTFGIQRKC